MSTSTLMQFLVAKKVIQNRFQKCQFWQSDGLNIKFYNQDPLKTKNPFKVWAVALLKKPTPKRNEETSQTSGW